MFAAYKTFNDPALTEARNAALGFIDDMVKRKAPRALTLCGPSGTGKTMLAKLIWERVGEYGGLAWKHLGDGRFYRPENRSCSWWDWRVISDEMKGGQYGAFEDATRDWFVVLDDIGADYDPNKFAASKLDKLLRSRRGWTVITANLYLPGIAESLDTRIASWMIRDGNKVVEVRTKDFSLRGGK